MARKISGASSILNLRSFKLVKLQTHITCEAEKILNEYLAFRNETDQFNEATIESVIDALITDRLANEKEFIEWKKSKPKVAIELKSNLNKKKIESEDEKSTSEV